MCAWLSFRPIRGLAVLAFAWLGPGSMAFAECSGVNLTTQMMPADLAAVQGRADAVPFPQGNFWTARRDDQQVTLIGTYHLDDPRHEEILSRLAPELEEAGVLLVEAGPKEEAALLKAMADDPSLMFITEGPTLIERLPRDTWRRLSQALEARGFPAFMASKLQPWYAMVVLAIPPCQIEAGADQPDAPQGLDGQLIRAAEALSLPVAALESHEAIFRIFDALSDEQSLAMIESTLAMEGQSEDFAVTLSDLYFAGQSRLIWELNRFFAYKQPGYSPEQVDEEMAVMEDLMMVRRNRAWIPVIERFAAEGEPVVAAFGALHLSGEDGVLNLLQQSGWEIREYKPGAEPAADTETNAPAGLAAP